MKTFEELDIAKQEARCRRTAERTAWRLKNTMRRRMYDPFTAYKLETVDRIARARAEAVTGHQQHVYFLEESGSGCIKIGTTINVQKRVNALQSCTPHTLKLLKTMRGDFRVESLLHELFKHAHVRGEWFRPVPELIEFIHEEHDYTIVDFGGMDVDIICAVMYVDALEVGVRSLNT